MALRKFVVIFGIALALFTTAPVYAHDADRDDSYHVHVSGTVWFDKNQDGIRQPNESVARGATIEVSPHGQSHDVPWLGSVTIKTDNNGNFSYLIRPGYIYYFHFNTVDYNDLGRPSYFACARTFIPPDFTGTELTVHLRAFRRPRGDRTPDLVPLDWPVVDGHFFKRANYGGGHCDVGFAVTNSDGIPFWDTWQELGLENVGYPISHRYMWRGFVTQAFQKAIMQLQPGKGVFFVNIFDELHDAGRDALLHASFQTPRQLEPLNPALPEGMPGELWEKLREEAQSARLALLDANPAIKERYYAAPDPLLLYGLPTSRVEDMGDHYAIRTQRTVLQEWKEDMPWAKSGEVTIANGGDLAKRLGEIWERIPDGGFSNPTHWFFPDPDYRSRPIEIQPRYILPLGSDTRVGHRAGPP